MRCSGRRADHGMSGSLYRNRRTGGVAVSTVLVVEMSGFASRVSLPSAVPPFLLV